MLTLPPLSLYIHIPWCVRKCPYCDFNSHEAGNTLPEEAYVKALKNDLSLDLPLVQGRKLSSIFIGGGTPSLFSPVSIGDILSAAEAAIGFMPDIEITLEANPGTVEQERFHGYRSAGVNRLSIGIQSFNDQQLHSLGRIHNRAEAIFAADSARRAGFDNFNLDLMHGLPEQNVAQAISDIQQAVALAPTHISWYQLTLEPNTAFYKRPPVLPEEDILEEIQHQGEVLLIEENYRQYEVSAYARNGNESRHNLNYWEFGDYLGIGAGAHGKITLPDKNDIVRTSKTRTPHDYLDRKNHFYAQRASIALQERPVEFFMNALRLKEGVPIDFYRQRTGVELSEIASSWQKLVAQGLLMPPTDRLNTTPMGYRFLNSVLASLSL